MSWTDASGQGGDASGNSSKAQVFDASGNRVGTEFLVNTQTANDQERPTITGLSNGGFVVSWEDASRQGGDASVGSIKAQVFDASGTKVGTEFLVNTETTGWQTSPTISGLSNGGFVVSWEDASRKGGDAFGGSIKAQVFTFDAPAPGVVLTNDTGASATDGVTRDGHLTLSGIEVGATLSYVVDGGAVSASYDPTKLADGAHTVSVTRPTGPARSRRPAPLRSSSTQPLQARLRSR